MQANNTQTSVLVVDDDDDIRYALSNILKKCDCDVTDAVSVEDAIEALDAQAVDIVFSDMRFHEGVDGEELLKFANNNLPNTQVVLMSCAMDSDRKMDLMAQGAAMCLEKPFFRDACLETLEQLNKRKRDAA